MIPKGPAERELGEPGKELYELAHLVIEAAIEVHRRLGPGLLESVYEQALCVELELRGIPFECQVRRWPLSTKGVQSGWRG